MKSLIKECCTDAWLDLVNATVKKISVEKNTNIFSAGEKALGLYEVIKGKVKVSSKDKIGNEYLLRLAGNLAILGHRGIGGNWKYSVTATALEDTTLLFIPRNTFEILAKTNPLFSYKLMSLFAADLKTTEEKFLHLSVLNRIASAILMNYRAFGINPKTNELNYTLSRQDLANAAITTYESTIRAIGELKKLNLIDTNNKSIRINNPKKLEAFVAESE